jgi:hypothetical protein
MKRRTAILTAATMTPFAVPAIAQAQTFIGQNFAASQWDPNIPRVADTNGAVGGDYFVELINPAYKVYRKSDGALVQSSTHNAFWAAAGAPPLPDRAFDPRVLYDPYARRWYALAADGFDPAAPSPGPNNFLFAVSNSSDPTAGWKAFSIDSDSNNDRWVDFPMLGYNRDVVTLSGVMFNVGTTSGAVNSTFVVIPKSDLLAATPTVANATKIEEITGTSIGFAVQPAVDQDNGSLPLPLLSNFNATNLKRPRVVGTPTSPSIDNAPANLIGITTNAAAPDADQPGPKPNLSTFSTRFLQNPVLNNGDLWGVHHVNVNGRAALRWYRIDNATNALIESGYVSDPTMAYIYPSIAVNDFGDVVIGMSGTAPETASDPDGTFVSAFAVVGKTVGGVTTFGTPFITKEGVSDFVQLDGIGRNRWGDYSATTNDPADPSIFWTIQEYVHATDVWGTQVTEIIIPQPGQVRWKDPASGSYGTSANWFGGAAPASTSHVIFSRATNPGGQGYTVSFASGQAVDRLSVRQGKVTLDLNGSTITATNSSDATPGLAVGEFGGTPQLNLVGGTVLADHALVGNDGVINIDGGGAALHVSQTFRVRDRGIVNFNSGIMSTGLLDVTGGRVNVAATGGAKVLRTTAVQTTSGARIDLTTNAMTVDYAPADGSPLLDVKAQIASAYASGAWDGPGIATSHGNASQFGLGYGEASALSTVPPVFGTVDDTSVLVRFTRYGDADLNGAVSLDDFNRLASGFGSTSAVWTQGDFTYDARVNLDDFNRLAGNFGLSALGPEVTPQDWSSLAAAVPEPGCGAVILAYGMMARRRRRPH